MNSRILLKQCFNCKNNLECWHLNTNMTAGKDARTMKPKTYSAIKFYLKNIRSTISEIEYITIRFCINAINPKIGNDEYLSHEYTQMVMLVLEGISNASNDFWCCPGDGIDSNETYLYEPVRDIECVEEKVF